MARSFFAILLSLAIAASASAQNTKRAFIVGVGDYDELTDLQKTVGDAEGYAAVFQNDLGFETVSLIDPDTDAFYDAFDAFIDSIQPGDDVAFIFSGHGWSNGAENYLAFSDAPYEATERSLERKTVSLPVDVLEVIKERNPNLVLAVIDACRDNPFDTGTRSVTRGLVPQSRDEGMAVIYAAGSRQKALDRLGAGDTSPYSVFTRNLLPKLRNPRQPLLRIFEDVRNETEDLASTIQHPQRPAVYQDISIDYCFAGAGNCATGGIDQEQEDWLFISSEGYGGVDVCTKYRNHLAAYPDGRFAEVARRNLENPPCGTSRQLSAEVRAAGSDAENWRAVDAENLLLWNTSKGRVLIELFPEIAPNHVARIREVTRAGKFDTTIFHRVVAGFVVQGGDVQTTHGDVYPDLDAEFFATASADLLPQSGSVESDSDALMFSIRTSNSENGGTGYHSGLPIVWQRAPETDSVNYWPVNCPGTVFAARRYDPNSANTQFYVNIRWATNLDMTDVNSPRNANTGWGRVLDGMNTLRTLRIGAPPSNPDVLRSAHIVGDLDENSRPIAYVQRTDGPDFSRALQHWGSTHVCEIPAVPARVAY